MPKAAFLFIIPVFFSEKKSEALRFLAARPAHAASP
jgi:hypothetical protein